jgi:hypothetical protein
MFRRLFAGVIADLWRRAGDAVERVKAALPPHPVDPGELLDLATKSRQSTRDPVVLVRAGQRLRGGVTHQDVDPATGKFYPDYLERRRSRDEAEAAKRAAPVLAGTLKHDCHPDD